MVSSKPETRASKIFRMITGFVLLLMIFGLGFLEGWYKGTGSLPPMGREAVATLPPDVMSTTFDKLKSAVKVDATNEKPYGEGWNCVDYAWTVMRALQWGGIDSAIVAIEYEDGTKHALVIVPTSDKGWVYFDPQTDAKVNPVVGGFYNGKKIAKIMVLTMKWVDIKEFKDTPIFEVTE